MYMYVYTRFALLKPGAASRDDDILGGADRQRGYRGCYVRGKSAGGVRRRVRPGEQRVRVRVPPGARVLITTKHPITMYSRCNTSPIR